MHYGKLPEHIGTMEIKVEEMMFYQYLPIKLKSMTKPIYEQRLSCFDELVKACKIDFINTFGFESFIEMNMYLTAKHQFQSPEKYFNRLGYHSDGFLTEDINYIWCDKNPTIFNNSAFSLTLDDTLSLFQMEQQAITQNEITFPENSLLRLDQYNIHKVAEIRESGMRTFVKISFSKDKYDLIGNSHNYLIPYKWNMEPRAKERNIPQSNLIK